MTPAFAACCSMEAPEAASRSTIMRTLTFSAVICWAMVFIFAAEPSAFWMSQSSLYWVQAALRALGSAVTHRGEEVVSGRMMPTFWFLPSISPEPPAAEEAGELAGGGVLPPPAPLELSPPLLLELQAERASRAAPSAAMVTVVLRMRRSRLSPLMGPVAESNLFDRHPVNVVRANISHGGADHAALIPSRYLFLLTTSSG